MTIAKLQELMLQGIVITKHARIRLTQRKITIADIKNAISNGKVIESYPNRIPFPAYLILGEDLTENPLHVIIASNDKHLKLVTCYYPNDEHFKDDNITRL